MGVLSAKPHLGFISLHPYYVWFFDQRIKQRGFLYNLEHSPEGTAIYMLSLASTLKGTRRYHGIHMSSTTTYWSGPYTGELFLLLAVSSIFFCLSFTSLGALKFHGPGIFPPPYPLLSTASLIHRNWIIVVLSPSSLSHQCSLREILSELYLLSESQDYS